MKRVLTTTISGLLLCVSNAFAVIIDFNAFGFTILDSSQSVTEDGFRFAQVEQPSPNTSLGQLSGANNCVPTCADNGTVAAREFNARQGGFFVISPVAGGSFSLLGFDAGESFSGTPANWADAINVIGNLAGGGQVTALFPLDQINDGTGGLADFQSFLLPPTFANLLSAEFHGTGLRGQEFAVDNINVVAISAVPEPGTLALLSVGLAVFGMSRRARKNKTSFF